MPNLHSCPLPLAHPLQQARDVKYKHVVTICTWLCVGARGTVQMYCSIIAMYHNTDLHVHAVSADMNLFSDIDVNGALYDI